MKCLLFAGLLLSSVAGWAQSSSAQISTDQAKTAANKATAAVPAAICNACGTVQTVKQVKRKGSGGIVGVAGGAVIGGLLGNQIGGGTGKTIATVGGAVAGGVVGNEVQKNVSSTKIWVTTVKMQDGSSRTFEQEPQPTWATGNVVKVDGSTLTKQ